MATFKGIERPVTRKNWREKLVHNWKGTKLKQEDWDFRRCPKDQLKQCVWWEHSREDVQYRLQWKDFLGDKRAGLVGKYGADTPWLLIPKDERIAEGTKDMRQAGEPAIYVMDWEIIHQPPGYCRKTIFGEALHVNGQSFLYPFSVDWHYSDTELKECFGEWIRANRPRYSDGADVFPIREKRGKRREVEMLKMIGARRLLQAYGLSKAKDITWEVLGRDYYKENSTWDKAVKKVEGCFRPVFFDEDLPGI